MNLLEERILKDGIVKPNNIIVSRKFLNQDDRVLIFWPAVVPCRA